VKGDSRDEAEELDGFDSGRGRGRLGGTICDKDLMLDDEDDLELGLTSDDLDSLELGLSSNDLDQWFTTLVMEYHQHCTLAP